MSTRYNLTDQKLHEANNQKEDLQKEQDVVDVTSLYALRVQQIFKMVILHFLRLYHEHYDQCFFLHLDNYSQQNTNS